MLLIINITANNMLSFFLISIMLIGVVTFYDIKKLYGSINECNHEEITSLSLLENALRIIT